MTSSPGVPRTSILHTNLAAPPPTITHASGPWLYSSSPNVAPIYDASGGAAVSSIGHAHPRVAKAIAAQVAKNEYVFAPHLTSPAYEELCQFLADSTGGRLPRAYICGSGSEAVEAAVKMARQYYVERDGPDTKRVHIISRDRSYHGNTLGALSVSGHKSRRAIYVPLLSSHTSTVSPCYAYRDQRAQESEDEYVQRLVDELEAEFQRVGPGNVCAVFLETMAGLTLGAVAALPGYLRKVKEVCERHGALFVLDEVLAGMGRTGTLHAWEQEDVVPDMQTLAKGLGAGYAPIGGLLVSQRIVDALMNGTGASPHFQTYQGHAIGCAAALEVQKVIEDEKLLENVRIMAPYIEQKLRERLGAHKNVGNIRGRGMLWAVELVQDRDSKEPFAAHLKVAAKIQATGLRDFGIALLPGPGVVDGVHGDVMVIAPPFTITREEVELVVERMANAIEAIVGKHERKAKL